MSQTNGKPRVEDVWINGLGKVQQVTESTHQLVADLRKLAGQQNTPAQLQTVELTQAKPIWRDEVREASLSVGFINPTGFVLRLGIAGGSASPTARGLPVPPNASLIVPIACEDLEVGLDDPAAVGSDAAVIYVLRFAAVQPFHLHRY